MMTSDELTWEHIDPWLESHRYISSVVLRYHTSKESKLKLDGMVQERRLWGHVPLDHGMLEPLKLHQVRERGPKAQNQFQFSLSSLISHSIIVYPLHPDKITSHDCSPHPVLCMQPSVIMSLNIHSFHFSTASPRIICVMWSVVSYWSGMKQKQKKKRSLYIESL